jgi:outer membrane protein assembly factor BamB
MEEHTVGHSTTRRRLLTVTGGAVAGAGALSGLSTGATDDGADAEASPTSTPSPTPTPPEVVWPLFQYDARNTGNRPGTNGPERSAGAVWARSDGEEYTTTPVVTESEVFVADEGAGLVRSLDAFTGEELWSTGVDTRSGRMTLEGRTLYVPTQESGAELQALDANTGAQKWSLSLASGGNGVVVVDGSAYVSTAGGVSKVSLLSETVSWEYDGVTLLGSTIAVEGDSVFAAGTRNGKVVKLSIASGSASWTTNLEGSATGAPTIIGNRVLVPFEDRLVSLRTDSGREEWRVDLGAGSSVAADDSTAYGVTADGTVFAADHANGARRWQTSLTSGSASPVLVGGVLFVVGTDGTVAGLNPRDGSTIWSETVPGPIGANPAVYDSDLYVADLAGQVAKLSAGASGGYDTPTPTPTDTPTSTATDSPTDTASPTQTSGEGGNGNGNSDNEGGVTTPIPGTTAPPSDGLGNLPLIGGAVAAVLAALGGGLWWRNNQQDDYDPLG